MNSNYFDSRLKSILEEKSEKTKKSLNGYITNIDESTVKNNNFRKVLYTAKNCQLVVMSLPPNEEIGEETHDVDQFFRVESGKGQVIINGSVSTIEKDMAIIVPAGSIHNLKNTGTQDLKLYTVYSPPHHKDGTIHKSRKDSMNDNEKFDGVTSE